MYFIYKLVSSTKRGVPLKDRCALLIDRITDNSFILTGEVVHEILAVTGTTALCVLQLYYVRGHSTFGIPVQDSYILFIMMRNVITDTYLHIWHGQVNKYKVWVQRPYMGLRPLNFPRESGNGEEDPVLVEFVPWKQGTMTIMRTTVDKTTETEKVRINYIIYHLLICRCQNVSSTYPLHNQSFDLPYMFLASRSGSCFHSRTQNLLLPSLEFLCPFPRTFLFPLFPRHHGRPLLDADAKRSDNPFDDVPHTSTLAGSRRKFNHVPLPERVARVRDHVCRFLRVIFPDMSVPDGMSNHDSDGTVHPPSGHNGSGIERVGILAE